MPSSTSLSTSIAKGLLTYISDVEKLEAEKVSVFLKSKIDLKIIENQIGNLLLYPQTIPVTEAESAFDLAVLKEMLRLEPENFYSPNLKKIYIPEAFVKIFPNLTKLAFLLIDALKPVCLTSFILKSENLGVRNLGTFIKPEKITPDGYVDIYISTNKFRVLSGNISIIPCSSPKFDLKLESNLEIIPGKKELITQVAGGDLGLIIDLC